MALGVVTLEPSEVIGRSPFREAIWIAGWDVEGIQDSQTILQIADGPLQAGGHRSWKIAKRTAQAMTPLLLPMAEMKGLQSFLHRLVAGKTSPLVMARGGTDLRKLQISLGLMEPVGGTVHRSIVARGPWPVV